MRLTWALLAVADRESIFDYIARDNAAAAVDLDELFQGKAALLVDHPQAGRVGCIQDTRELVVHRHYVFVYDLQKDRVRILRVLPTSLQRLPVKPPTKARKGK